MKIDHPFRFWLVLLVAGFLIVPLELYAELRNRCK
jgi:hypothetical protein